MDIPDIKSNLSILQVLSHYGITPDKNKRINCPFHNDKTPSMQVYPDTHTVFCFSSNCKLNGRAIDQIDFIMHKEGCTKHEALQKAKELITPGQTIIKPNPTPTMIQPVNNTDIMGRIAVLTKLMYEAKDSLSRSTKAQEYCKQRGLDWKNRTLSGVEVGFLELRYYHSWNEQLKQSAIAIGLLKELPNTSLSPVFRSCVIFPIKNKQGQIISIYGRSVMDSKESRHFYLKGKHEGIYPKYPEPSTTALIITESIIDTVSLLQVESIAKEYSVLSMYGTNGLTEEHVEAIKSLVDLQEIIFMLDADEAGNKAVAKYSEQLHTVLNFPPFGGNAQRAKGVKISKAALPDGEDVNSLLQGHDAEIIHHIIQERKLIFSNENKNICEQNNNNEPSESISTLAHQPIITSLHQPISTLNTNNPNRIHYTTDQLKIEIWGGIEYNNLHRLRLSLHVENKATGRSFRDDVNLYSHRSSKAFIQDASEELNIPQSEIKQVIAAFTKEVESYRVQQQATRKDTQRPAPVTINLHHQTESLQILQNKNLITHIKASMQKVGLIGETDNGLLLFLIFLTRYFDTPLHALVHGSTGSGKTNLLKSILKLVPPESKYETTALTENVLFRPPYKDFWKNKILLIEDLDGSYKALLPLREFMTNQYISKFASEPNPKTGKYEQALLEAHGPIVIAGATTKDRVYEDNSNRSYLLHVNESSNHQEQIIDYQNKAAAGLIDQQSIENTCKKIHNLQRMLHKDIKIINPFQPQLKLPEYIFRKLRTNTHYITLIQAITFLFQHQRTHKQSDRGYKYIETTLHDIELANRLSKESLLRKSDELSGAVRDFFELLKIAVKENNKEIFLAKEIRGQLRMHPMKFSRYISELQQRGYVRQAGGNYKTGYEYRIAIWDDYQVLKDGLKIMDEILEKLWKRYPDGAYHKEEKMQKEHPELVQNQA